MAAVEKKINMTLDDIIKASSTRSTGGAGPERRQQSKAAQDERIPLPKNGIAPKFIGTSARQAARPAGRPAPASRALGLTARQAPMKKYAQSRAPLHVSIPATTTATRNTGRPGGKVTDVRVTIPNNRKIRSVPPPGFAVADDELQVPPPGMAARAGRGGTGRAQTLNERFTRVLSATTGVAAVQPRRRSAGSGRGGRRGTAGNGGAAPMEL